MILADIALIFAVAVVMVPFAVVWFAMRSPS